MSLYIVAEIGVNHDGSLQKAFKLIEQAKKCGCNAVKFQSFYADKLVSKRAKKVDYQLRSGDSRESHYDMIKKLEFNGDKLTSVINYSKDIGIDFITTPYDPDSIEEAYSSGVRIFKTASADLRDIYIHEKLQCYKDIKIIIATGMSTISSIKRTIHTYPEYSELILLHCVSGYPCSDKSLNLLSMDLMKEEFKAHQIGFSDHSLGATAAIICAGRGYTFFEKHFTLNKFDEGPDHYASADVDEMFFYVRELKRVSQMIGDKRKAVQREELGMSLRSKKAIKAAKRIKKGELVTTKNTFAIRPAEEGISIDNIELVIGKHASKDIESGQFILLEDLN